MIDIDYSSISRLTKKPGKWRRLPAFIGGLPETWKPVSAHPGEVYSLSRVRAGGCGWVRVEDLTEEDRELEV